FDLRFGYAALVAFDAGLSAEDDLIDVRWWFGAGPRRDRRTIRRSPNHGETDDVDILRFLECSFGLESKRIKHCASVGERRPDSRRRFILVDLDALLASAVIKRKRRRPDLDVLAQHPAIGSRDDAAPDLARRS